MTNRYDAKYDAKNYVFIEKRRPNGKIRFWLGVAVFCAVAWGLFLVAMNYMLAIVGMI